MTTWLRSFLEGLIDLEEVSDKSRLIFFFFFLRSPSTFQADEVPTILGALLDPQGCSPSRRRDLANLRSGVSSWKHSPRIAVFHRSPLLTICPWLLSVPFYDQVAYVR